VLKKKFAFEIPFPIEFLFNWSTQLLPVPILIKVSVKGENQFVLLAKKKRPGNFLSQLVIFLLMLGPIRACTIPSIVFSLSVERI